MELTHAIVDEKGNRKSRLKSPNNFCVIIAKLILLHHANRAMRNEGPIAFDFQLLHRSANLGSILESCQYLLKNKEVENP